MRCHPSQAILVADKTNQEIAKTIGERVTANPDITLREARYFRVADKPSAVRSMSALACFHARQARNLKLKNQAGALALK